MSQIRVYRDGKPTWERYDDGASARHSKLGIRGGLGNPVVYGSLAVGESTRDRDKRLQREWRERAK